MNDRQRQVKLGGSYCESVDDHNEVSLKHIFEGYAVFEIEGHVVVSSDENIEEDEG